MVHGKQIEIRTNGFSDIKNITDQVKQVVSNSGVTNGLVAVTAIGSTASITTIEYEPNLVKDMQEQLEKLWPEKMGTRHGKTWGDDNGFSHLRASFLGSSESFPISNGSVILGTWQQIIVIDHDNNPRSRKVYIQVVGEK
ncbi:MAG: secondary thiamine-phosphate synthase enzyme YjbQ [Candidatus Marinimicrobia bacterium]|nr:secondary thiamine-phosphate synthase enzyme YjbQ [Candidatus Neomarinimicrobiota bacterium]